MASKSGIRDNPTEARGITATRIVEMDATAEDMHPQRYKVSTKHKNTPWTTLNSEGRALNNDTRIRRVSFGGNDGKGAPFFSSLTKQKRTDAALFQASFGEQVPAFGFPEKLFRKWVTGRGVPNTHDDMKKG